MSLLNIHLKLLIHTFHALVCRKLYSAFKLQYSATKILKKCNFFIKIYYYD
jgi:hypothetical protein